MHVPQEASCLPGVACAKAERSRRDIDSTVSLPSGRAPRDGSTLGAGADHAAFSLRR